ncbi:hypothetical protein Mal15_35700 [Stieleria maiorica]|uniref:Uncharacterized protein n=1 Tax=Stieleria maiorica TaxID=2795974 RepID=A0A5B9MIR8_9BACT|nr:hypothetical protein [Stieleria maiorica]QEF99505.1 hypothetical protein Mal15_35700 [Stieleria maiorica]
MFWNRTNKSQQTPRSAKCALTAKRRRAVAAKAAVCLAIATVTSAPSVVAADPESSELPSYVNNTPLTIAALVQGDGQTPPTAEAADTTTAAPAQVDVLNDPVDALPEDVSTDRTVIPEVTADQVNRRSLFADRQTELADGKLVLPPIEALTTGTSEIGNGELPLGFRQGEASPLVQLPESGLDRGLPWHWTARHWAAANTFSHPLYFEDRMLERHGHQRFSCFQPLVSGGRFLAQAVSLPYLTAISPPSECQYSLGYYRAGSCAPALKQRPPYQRKAVASQVTAVGVATAILQ